MAATADLAKRFVTLAFCRADLLFELDDDHRIAFAAGMGEELLGRSPDTLVGTPFTGLLREEDAVLIGSVLDGADPNGRLDDIEVGVVVKSGQARDAFLSGYRAPDFDNHFFLALKLRTRDGGHAFRRIGDRDADTQALTAEAFPQAAARGIKAVVDSGADAKLTLISIAGLDDARSRLSGEGFADLLASIGESLAKHSIGGDTVGRIADDGFGLVHTEEITESDIQSWFDRAESRAGADVDLKPESQNASVGGLDLTVDEVRKAIEYTVRGFNRDRSLPQGLDMKAIFERMVEETMQEVDAFKRVCSTREFDLHFMPICDLATGRVHHLETLSRFRGQQHATASPYELITLAEEIGVIVDFDLAVARKTVDTLKGHAHTESLAPLAFNVSGLSIANDGFVRALHDILKAAVNMPSMVSIEITESAVITDFERVNAIIQSFRERRFKVALDDFGAGAAGFDYLNSFEIDAVKFDGPVVNRALKTLKGKAFLASMATLCAETGIETVAEMVETEDTARFLAGLGIRYGQGFRFGRPGPDPTAYPKLARL